MTVQTAVLIETLVSLGAEVVGIRKIFSMQDYVAAAAVVGPHGTPEQPQGVPVFSLEGRDARRVLRATEYGSFRDAGAWARSSART